MKKISKKGWIAIIIILLIIAIIGTYFLLNKNNGVTFYVNKKACDSYEAKVEYKKDMVLDAKTLKVSATFDGKDISKQLEVKEVKVNALKKYKVTFALKDREEILEYTVNVVDTTPPKVEGNTQYEVLQNKPFSIEQLQLQIQDNYDEDFMDRISMPAVDTSVLGEQEVRVIIKDSSKNTTSFKIKVKVVEKIAPNTSTGYQMVSNPNSIAVLVNKQFRLPEGWEPSDLVSIGEGHSLRSAAAKACNSMRAAATADGVNINVVSTFRTQSYQQSLYNNYYAKDPEGAPFYSAYPRASEHELGLAIDISYDEYLHDDLQNTTLGKWMSNNAHKFGFIMRYPSNKTNITQYMFEPWHYRYVGVSLAKELRKKEITLEEYYQ